MPIKITLAADVTDLKRGTTEARQELQRVGAASEGMARQLRASRNAFDGTRIEGAARRVASDIERIGGVAKLTDREIAKHSRTISEALQKYERMNKEAPAAIRRVGEEFRQAQAAARQLETASAGAASAFSRGFGALAGGLGIGVGAGLGIGAITALGGAIRDIAADGARLAPLQQSFERLQGGAVRAQMAMADLRAATRGLVSDADLMQAANKSSLLGLDAMGIQFDEVATVALALGRAMGQDAAQSVDDLTTALARQSPMILDNLGIKMNLTEATESYARSLGKSTDALTDEERKRAFATAAMEAARAKVKELGSAELTAAENASRAATSVSSLAAELGAAANQADILVKPLSAVADVLGLIRGAGIGTSLRVALAEAAARSESAIRSVPGLGLTPIGMSALMNLQGIRQNAQVTPQDWAAIIAAVGGGPRRTGAANALASSGATASASSPVAELEAARRALGQLTAAQREAIRAAKELGQSNKEAAQAAGTTEAVVRLFEAMQRGADTATGAAQRLQAELDKLRGADLVNDATALVENLDKVGTANVLPRSMPSLVEQLGDALTRARELGPTFAQQAGQIERKLRELVNSPAYRAFFQRSLANPTIGVNRNLEDPLFQRTGLTGAVSPMLYPPSPLSTIPGEFDTFAAQRMRNSIAGITVDLGKGLKPLREWQSGVRDIAQAFANFSQIAGPSMDRVGRGIGSVFAGLDIAQSLLERYGTPTEDGGRRLSGLGRLATGASVGLTLGSQMGQLTTNPWLAGGLGAGTSALALIGTGAATMGIGAAVGAGVAIYQAWRQGQAQKKALAQQRQDLIASVGTIEDFRRAVELAGFDVDYFMQQFNSNDVDTFNEAVRRLNAGLAEERQRATALGKALQEVARVQGVLSPSQFAQIRGAGPGSSSAEAIVQFADQQRQQGEAGLVLAASALIAQAALTEREIVELTAGISDEAEQLRVVEAELARRARGTLQQFGTAASATANGLFVAFNEALRAGESAVTVLGRLAPSIQGLQQLYQRAGMTPGAGLAQLSSYAGIATDPQTAPAVQLATGLGQALAGFANSGLLSPELFGELANGIGQAYKQLELLGKGGLDAARMMQPSLQAIWQMIQDNPALRDELDDTTLALLDFAEEAGLIGEEFRPAVDRMIDALNDLIAKLDEFIDRLSNVPTLPAPGNNEGGGSGDGAGGGGGGGNSGGGNGGEYTTPLATGGIVTRPTRALIGEAGPEAVIPLSRSGLFTAPINITVVSQIDGYEAARAITRHQANVFRGYGAA